MKTEVTRFRCTKEQKEAIIKIAESYDMTISEFLLFLVNEKLDQLKGEE